MLNNWLQFRPILDEADRHFLFSCFTNPQEQYLCFPALRINTFQDFEIWLQENLRSDFHTFFLITIKSQTVGFIYSYRQSLIDQLAFIAIYLTPPFRQGMIGSLAMLYFLNYLFSYYPLKRAYMSVYDYNVESIQNLHEAGFEEAGCLKKARYWQGKENDILYFSIEPLKLQMIFEELNLSRDLQGYVKYEK